MTALHPIFTAIFAAHFPAPKRWNLHQAQRGIGHFKSLRRAPLADALRTTCDCRGCKYFLQRHSRPEVA